MARGRHPDCGDRDQLPRPVTPKPEPAPKVYVRRRHALPTYSGTHQRVRAALGPASAQLCVTCEAQAHHWSYDEADPEPMRDVDGSHAGVPYSIDPEHYHPRCRKCHKGLDNALRGKRGSLTLLHHWFVVWRDKLVREGRNEGD